MEKNLNEPQSPELITCSFDNSIYDEVRKFDNEQLRELLKEARRISEQDAPAHFKQSKTMKQLFIVAFSDFYSWGEQFSNVQRAIEFEILRRVRTDAW